jgi:hypothetical protein
MDREIYGKYGRGRICSDLLKNDTENSRLEWILLFEWTFSVERKEYVTETRRENVNLPIVGSCGRGKEDSIIAGNSLTNGKLSPAHEIAYTVKPVT